MSSLRPANSWIPKRVKISKSLREKKHVTDDWYPTPASIEFLDDDEYQKSDKDKVRANWMKRTCELARKDPNVFAELIMDNDLEEFEDYEPYLHQAWFHKELHRLLDKGMRGKGSNSSVAKHRQVAIVWPRSAGKTHQIIARVIWELGNNPNLRVKLTAESDKTAKKRAYEIKTHLEKNKWVHAVFPNLKPAQKDVWTNTAFYVKRQRISRDPSFEACGVLGSATGGRADILIGDDVVGRRNALTQPAMRKEVKGAWNSVWMNLLTKGGRAIYICTPWHKDDLSHEIVAKRTWITFMVSVGANYETPWPARWDKEELALKHEDIGTIEYNRAYRHQAADESDVPIESDWIHYIDSDDVPLTGLSFLFSVDLALGKKAGDFFAITIFAINMAQRQAYVVDYINKRISAPAQIKEIGYLSEKWDPSWVVLEAVGYQEALADILRVSPELDNRKGTIHSYHPSVNKRLRLEMAAPETENGRVKFLKRLDPDIPENKKGLLVKQIIDFGIEPNDDLSDSWSQGVNFIREHLHLWTKRKGISAKVIG